MSISSTTPVASTQPYLIRAIYEWCTDNGFTPYLAVFVDGSVQVPMDHVQNNEIVLNISFDATSALKIGNEWVEFKARFSGTARDIVVPIDHVIAIYARENGQGMAFPMPKAAEPAPQVTHEAPAAVPEKVVKLVSAVSESEDVPTDPTPPKAGATKPALKRIK